MLGAVFGDIVGSAYEWNNVKTKDFPLERSGTRYTDDSVMTLAVAKWLLEDPSHSESHLIKCMQKLGRGHIRAGYGGRFTSWLLSKEPQPYNSWGNGSAMRVSPVALYANTLEEALELARTSANVTHNHPEGVKGAMAVAECVFICRKAADLDTAKKVIKETIPRKYGYNLDRTLDKIRLSYTFDVSCQGSVPEAIIAFLESDSLEDCVRNAVSLGGDSDTIAAIACSIYSVKNNQVDTALAKRFEHYLSVDLRRIMENFEKMVVRSKPITNSYKVNEQIFAGEYPRNKDLESSQTKLKQFETFGITHFIDLTEEGELGAYSDMLHPGATHLRFPIRDVSVPKSMEGVHKLVDYIIDTVSSDPSAKVYIHCWGGVGRTGLIVGCLLAQLCKLDYKDALSKLEELFNDCPKSEYRTTPETADQHQFIADFINSKKDMQNDGNKSDKFNLARFLEAQEYWYEIALEEVREGRKSSHWIWFIFPQLSFLGHSYNAKYYGLSGLDEAEAYLNNPVLGARLRTITEALLTHREMSATDIFGGLDAMKVRSCMTLFDTVSPDDVFAQVLDVFYHGVPDKRTLDWMA
ncbi:MAG: DUF1810 family protein [Bacteroidaceae bacterium]|nr:DUF1810 family protein [Bacteroidaceae bacterium]